MVSTRNARRITEPTGGVINRGPDRSSDARTEQWRTQDVKMTENDTDAAFQNLANIDMSDNEEVQMQRERIATEFAKAQRTDATLQVGWTRARRGSQEFKVINGLLYKRTQNDTNTVEDYALAVPQKYRDELLAVSHNCITAGHVGTSKSRQRLQAYFYWPKLQRDVADYVRKCQLTAPLKIDGWPTPAHDT